MYGIGTSSSTWVISLVLLFSTSLGCQSGWRRVPPSPPAAALAAEPLEAFALAPGALAGLRLCLDPRPGGGAEADLVLPLALHLRNLAARAGAAVVSTRFTLDPPGRRKETLDLEALLRAARADLLLRLQCHPEGGRTDWVRAEGPPRAAKLAAALRRRLAGETKAEAAPRATEPPIPELTLRLALPRGEGRTPWRRPAVRIAQGLADWWRDAAGEVKETRDRIYPVGPKRPRRPTSFWPVAREPRTEKEVASLVRAWHRAHAVDPTQAWLEARVVRDGEGWRLEGAAELPVMENALRRMLEQAGVKPLAGGLRTLPGEEAGRDPFGQVTVAAALTWRHPTRGAGLPAQDGPGQTQQTQVLYGEPVWILEAKEGCLLVHAGSGYLGWVRREAVRRLSRKAFDRLVAAPKAVFRRETRVEGIRLPVGAALPLVAIDGRRATLRLPGGKEKAFALDLLRLPGSRAGEEAARTALQALGTPYLWGGRSRLGLDCSGLVQTSWAAQGLFLPRDSRMQVLCGRLVGTAAHCPPLRPGDLLFFTTGTGRIGHVALSLGGHRFVHAVMPEVTLGSLDPEDPLYSPTAKRFALAKRVAP